MSDPLSEIVEIGARAAFGNQYWDDDARETDAELGRYGPCRADRLAAMERAISALYDAGYVVVPPASASPRVARDSRQRRVGEWCVAAFGAEHATSLPQRAVRALEEMVELYQACKGDLAMAHKLLDFVFSRPVGTVEQELGGVGLTVLALANAAGLSADEMEAREFDRVLSKPLAHFRARNEAKNAAGFDVRAYPTAEGESPRIEAGAGGALEETGQDIP